MPIGRPKGSKSKQYYLRQRFKKEPHNFAFWKITLKNPEEVNAFLDRGSAKQIKTIKEILTYIKKIDEELFERVNGKEILKELNA